MRKFCMRLLTPLLAGLLLLSIDQRGASDTPSQALPAKQPPYPTAPQEPVPPGVDMIGEKVTIGGTTFYLGLFRLGANPGFWLFRDMQGLAVVDGDIALGPFKMVLAQQQALRKALQSPMFALATLPGSFARWPDGEVPVSFEGDWFAHEIPADRRQPIRDAMRTYERLTPVVFRPKTDDDQSWVRFARTWDFAVCPNSSTGAVGRVNGPTTVYIQLTDCEAGGGRSDGDIERSALHEIGHALGFKHEHTRADRDEFIEIDFDCINQTPISAGVALLGNYNVSSDDYEAIGPYDFDSIMHYPSGVRLDDEGNVTCVTVAKRPEHRAENDALGLIGPNVELSREDINALYHMYRRNDQTNEQDDRFGRRILAHDFDGDGYADLAVSALFESLPGGARGGAVMLYKGTASGYVFWKRLDPPVPEQGQLFGAALAAADFDLDGVQDLAVGAPGTSAQGKADAGAVFIYEISANLEAAHRRTLIAPGGAEAHDRFGQSLAVGRFFRLPAEAEARTRERRRLHLAIGAPGARTPETTWRPGYVWFWSEDMPEAFGWPDVDASELDWAGGFGAALAAIESGGFTWMSDPANDQRRTPLLVSSASDDGLDCGRASVLVMAGPPGGGPGIEIVQRLGDPDAQPVSPSLCAMARTDPVAEDAFVATIDRGFGRALTVGDFDGDGVPDLAVGNPEAGHSASAAGAGRVHIYAGSDPLGLGGFVLRQTIDQASLGANEPGDAFGAALAAADFDADGLADLAVGSPSDDMQGAQNAGAVFLYRGCRPFARWFTREALDLAARGEVVTPAFAHLSLLCAGPLAPWQSLTQPGDTDEENDVFGSALAPVDVDADGDLDLVVGTPGEAPGSEPRSGYVHFIKSKGAGASDNFSSTGGFSQETVSAHF